MRSALKLVTHIGTIMFTNHSTDMVTETKMLMSLLIFDKVMNFSSCVNDMNVDLVISMPKHVLAG